MTKIFKHLAKHWAACLVIIALLLVQAYGDLTLPDYTSKIVDTGIQQSGIADAVPEVVRDSTLQVLELLMTDADAAAVEAAYTQPGGTDNALSSATSLQKKLASPYTVRLLRADADRDTLAAVDDPYYHTDHHWTTMGAQAAYGLWAQATGHTARPYTLTAATDRFRGNTDSNRPL